MDSLLVFLLGVLLLAILLMFPHIRRGYQSKENHKGNYKTSQIPMKALAIPVTPMSKPMTRPFTYQDESAVAAARQRVWIRYEDYHGDETERKIEIYHAQDDEYVFGWCCLRREPRTFNRNNITAWQVLDEQFEFDPLIDRYWREEGIRERGDKIPWKRWIQAQGKEVAEKYERKQASHETSGSIFSNYTAPQATDNRTAPTGPSWWQLRESALVRYSKLKSTNQADYAEVIEMLRQAIELGASVSAQAQIHRTLGDIYYNCNNAELAIEHFERALRLNPAIGVKKLLARLKADVGYIEEKTSS